MAGNEAPSRDEPDAVRTLLLKVVSLELRQECRDLAVVGGFARFAVRKLLELAGTPAGELAAARPEALERHVAWLEGYQDAGPEERRRELTALLHWLQGAPAPPPPGAAARPAPPPTEDAAPPPRETPIQFVKGVGPKRAGLLERLGLHVRADLLYHLPLRYEDRRHPVRLGEVRAGDLVTVIARVRAPRAVRGRHARAHRFQARLEDESGVLEGVWFGQLYLAKLLVDGVRVLLHGKVGERRGQLQLQSPSFEILQEDEAPRPGLVPVYPLTEGLHQNMLRRLVGSALDDLAAAEPEVLPGRLRVRLGLPDLPEALRRLHRPEGQDQVEAGRERLALEELLVLQVALALKQRHQQEPDPSAAVVPGSDLVPRFKASLPFRFTRAQERAEAEILADLAAPRAMSRLLQGDVGSGKTVLAAAALLATMDSGQQAALMAPTEILAEQHVLTLTALCAPLGIRPELLLGGLPRAARGELLARLATGQTRLVVGTHALIEPDVEFQQLGLIVIDEQHRFGVAQRARLRRKMGGHPNTLVMTATPIPRTLSLTLYGDLDLTVLDELPPGRQPIQTDWKRPRSLPKVWSELRATLEKGAQAYVVCPLIEESEKLEAQAATDLAAELAAGPFSGLRLGLLHGRLRNQEKEEVMTRFRQGDLDLLVATTVIEVGVDVPNASWMVILNAERFGLAQLHQLRGRVGRGRRASRCTLISSGGGEETRRRLRVMLETGDGFRVAEEDLAIRGPGEYFGTRQAGLPELRFADLTRDTRLLAVARREARALVTGDPELASPELAQLAARVREKFAPFLEYRH